jgi:hypothetical protein
MTRHPEMPTRFMATLTPTLSLSQGEGANLIGSRLVTVIRGPQRLGGSAREELIDMPPGVACEGALSIGSRLVPVILVPQILSRSDR